MKKSAVQLLGNYYFDRAFLPLKLQKVRGKVLTHIHDYTGINHWHDFTELVIITSGQGIHNINGVSYPVSVGDVFVIGGRTTHYFEDYTYLGITNIIFENRLFDGMQEYLNRIPGYHVVFRFEPELRTSGSYTNSLHLASQELSSVIRITEQLDFELQKRFPGSEAAAIGKMLELMVFLSRALNSSPSEESQPAALTRLASLTSMLESSFHEDWDLQRMAKFCGMSVNTLLRNFQAVIRQTPLQYLTALRLNAAGNMLKNGSMAVSEIAFACGFHDSNYFAKCFRKHFRCSPSSFRRGEKETTRVGE
ncbi:MAG: helix-turn-helix domain-containing protein [Lentisphaeria bacterium]|nr:helix-turn-helix domain-containing protein [Lentisphaeria bacterium]